MNEDEKVAQYTTDSEPENINEQDIKEETEEDVVEVLTEEDLAEEDQQVSDVELQEVMEEKEQLQDRLLRLQAEYDNFKKRTEKERIAERKYKSQDVISELLPVLDNFERALQTEVTESNQGFLEGVQMVYNQLTEAIASQGVEPIAAVNEEFDPNLHHAVMQVEEEDIGSNVVVEELQKGFMLKDKVIRPAMVKVNK